MSDIKIEKITFIIGGKAIELSMNEARALRDVLNREFPTATAPVAPTPYIPTWTPPQGQPTLPNYHQLQNPYVTCGPCNYGNSVRLGWPHLQ